MPIYTFVLKFHQIYRKTRAGDCYPHLSFVLILQHVHLLSPPLFSPTSTTLTRDHSTHHFHSCWLHTREEVRWLSDERALVILLLRISINIFDRRYVQQLDQLIQFKVHKRDQKNLHSNCFFKTSLPQVQNIVHMFEQSLEATLANCNESFA